MNHIKDKHKINKVFIDIHTNSLESSTSIKNDILYVLKEKSFPQFEEILDDYNQTGSVKRFHSITLLINIPRFDYLNILEDELKNKFKIEIVNAISDLRSGIKKDEFDKVSGNNIPIEKNREEIFLYFLENGFLPWYGTEKDILELLGLNDWEKSIEKPEFISFILKLLQKEATIVNRFIYQIDDLQKVLFLKKVNPVVSLLEKVILIILENSPLNIRNILFRLLISSSINTDSYINVESITLLLDMVISLTKKGKLTEAENKQFAVFINNLYQVSVRTKTDNISTENKVVNIDRLPIPEKLDYDELSVYSEIESGMYTFNVLDKEEILIQNAGLIILHPFLKTFFGELGMLDKNERIRVTDMSTAIQALHFLATGKANFFEGNLILEKYICGAPLKVTVERECLLSEKIKDEAINMLREVIRQWPELKNSSVDDLRELFIQRNGKLIQKGSKYKIIVERKVQDLLLDKLSWNISAVNFPWRKDVLFVDW